MKRFLLPLILCLSLLSFSSTPASEVIKYNGSLGSPRPQIYAHQAIRGLLPEQTMPGYVAALRLGIDYVDMDIGMTKDGVLVITHDLTLNPDLTRDPAGDWIKERIPIRELPLSELQKHDVGRLKPGTKYASYFPQQRPVDQTPIPTLKEVVQFVKKNAGYKVGFQIEIKTDPNLPEQTASPAEFAAALYELMKEEQIIDRTEVQAFVWRCLIELNRLDPKIKTAYLTDHTTQVLDDKEKGDWTAGLLPKDHGYSFPKMIKHLGGYCWEPFQMDLTKDGVEEAHKLGLKVVPWGWPEKEESEFNYERVNELIDWGVDGIITDRPDILRGILAVRGYDVPSGCKIKWYD